MVENFTTVNESTFENVLNQDTTAITLDDGFEKKIKQNLQNLKKEPSKKTIENLINYSKTF